MRVLPSLTHDRKRSPARILRFNAVVYLVLQAIFSAVLIYCVLTHDSRIITICLISAALPPIFVLGTYRECRRSWLGLPHDDMDWAVPVLTVTAIMILVRIAISYY